MASVSQSSSQSKASDGGEMLNTRKRKQALVEKESSQPAAEPGKGKRRKPTSKVIPKKKHQDLLKHLRAIESNILRIEMRAAVEEQFGEGQYQRFLDELFKQDEPILEIATQHRKSFAVLYGECKQQKNSFMHFQLQYQYHCSAFILEEEHSLAAIKLNEANHATLVAARKTWLEFCKKLNLSVPLSNPIMIAMSSRVYSYLLNQVSIYQDSLTDQTPVETTLVCEDGDDVYYRFGGATICSMLKLRYSELKTCSRTDRNAISIQVCMLKAMNLKDKSGIPEYLQYRDRGYMYFPHTSLLPFLRAVDTVVKRSVNEDEFRKHGDSLIKVGSNLYFVVLVRCYIL